MTRAPEHTTARRQGRRTKMLPSGHGEQKYIVTIPNDPPTLLSARLRRLREDAGMSQSNLAPLLRTGANRVSDWELGVVTPSLAILGRYSKTFGVTVSQILAGVM